MVDKNVEAALAALGGARKEKTGTGPVEATVVSSGSAVEDLGALVEKNVGLTQEVLSLAREAALAADESRVAGARARVLKSQLEFAMKEADIAEIEMDDRDPIAFATTVSKAKTLKALKNKMAEGAADDEARVQAQAKAKSLWDEFWGRFPSLPSTSLEIPKPRELEPDGQ